MALNSHVCKLPIYIPFREAALPVFLTVTGLQGELFVVVYVSYVNKILSAHPQSNHMYHFLLSLISSSLVLPLCRVEAAATATLYGVCLPNVITSLLSNPRLVLTFQFLLPSPLLFSCRDSCNNSIPSFVAVRLW